MSWGINSIPCVFLVDAEGNLATVKARGKLETLIPGSLEKAKGKGGIKSAPASPQVRPRPDRSPKLGV